MSEPTQSAGEPKSQMDGESTATSSQSRTETEVTTGGPSNLGILGSFVRRELSTVVLSASYMVLVGGLVVVIGGLALVGGGFEAGYMSTVFDLLMPLQLLVPLVAFALGYNAVLGDEQRGELDVLRTYPVRAWHVVSGAFFGRAIGIVLAIGVPLVLLFIPILTTEPPRMPMYASHTGADSPILYLRFVVLTILFALVMLAVAVAISALVSSTRGAIAGGALAIVALVFGLDLALAFGYSLGAIGDSGLMSSLALSPVSAYRGLVLDSAVTVAAGTGPETASPLASLVGLLVWGVGSLTVATVAMRR